MRLLCFVAGFAASGGVPGPVSPRPLAHFYYVDDAAAWRSLERNIRSIGLLSPVWLYVQADGSVRAAIDPKVHRLAQDSRVGLMPVVMNEDFKPEIARAVLASTESIHGLAAELAAIADRNRFQGLQLDFENLGAADRDGYSALAGKLGELLHRKRMKLSVAVAAPVYSTGPVDEPAREYLPAPRAAAFDYTGLAASADFLTLMSYDQYATADAPGPIAGIEWMEQCIARVLESVPAPKLTLGLPLYHRRWSGGRVTTGSWAEVNPAEGAVKLHPVHREPVASTGEGVVWFQDAQSLAIRTELVAKYKLRGFSAWRLGQEDPAAWPRVFAADSRAQSSVRTSSHSGAGFSLRGTSVPPTEVRAQSTLLTASDGGVDFSLRGTSVPPTDSRTRSSLRTSARSRAGFSLRGTSVPPTDLPAQSRGGTKVPRWLKPALQSDTESRANSVWRPAP